MLRTQWVTRTTCSNRTSRLVPAVGITMLTGGCALQLGDELVDAGWSRSRSTRAGSPIRSQWACSARVPASNAQGFAASPPPAAEVSSIRQW